MFEYYRRPPTDSSANENSLEPVAEGADGRRRGAGDRLDYAMTLRAGPVSRRRPKRLIRRPAQTRM
ncbi:hypothetical protein I546_2058 [Mycobacterium kansasii 732]|nr:hypothetical protein I546_2058 [Mycobacterium kansasii 732]